MTQRVKSGYHEPVLAEAVVEFLVRGAGIYVDGTLGGGGHSLAVLERLQQSGFLQQSLLVGIDQDSFALEAATLRLKAFEQNSLLVRGNFSDIGKIVETVKGGRRDLMPVCGILLDLGVSSFQIDTPHRGFSYLKDGPLDMRMDPDGAVTAEDIVNDYEERELARLFHRYGEEPLGGRIAHAIARSRDARRITTTEELSAVVRGVQHRRDLVIKTLSRIYQALRIEVNDELGVLHTVLQDAMAVLAPGGRIAVISYHSLEDRIVKQCFASCARSDWGPKGVALREPLHKAVADLVTRKPVLAGDDEIERNPRARSAKLRVMEKL